MLCFKNGIILKYRNSKFTSSTTPHSSPPIYIIFYSIFNFYHLPGFLSCFHPNLAMNLKKICCIHLDSIRVGLKILF